MTPDDPGLLAHLCARLRRAPMPSSVPGSMPVLFFGNLFSAQVATVGHSPSHQEYLDRSRRELEGSERRLETLRSIGASDRETLTTEQCLKVIRTMQDYFGPGKPVYSWFRPLDRVMQAMGFSYAEGQAAHLDLVQEATDPTWSQLAAAVPAESQALVTMDTPFLQWEFVTFPLRAVICNGRTVLDTVRHMTGGRVVETGRLARITWTLGVANVNQRNIVIAGWNIPLARPTGLGAAGETELGRLLATRIDERGLF